MYVLIILNNLESIIVTKHGDIIETLATLCDMTSTSSMSTFEKAIITFFKNFKSIS